mmetsp:Transcript_23134/g.32344  ORF Transcript_23134/g.32344 Transcript_23134/m.32344 type:complete len:94 (-) Transcript_23134:59-340(-)
MPPRKRRVDYDRPMFAQKRYPGELREPWRRWMRGATFVLTVSVTWYMVFHADFNQPGSRIPQHHVFTDIRSWYHRKLATIFPKPPGEGERKNE